MKRSVATHPFLPEIPPSPRSGALTFLLVALACLASLDRVGLAAAIVEDFNYTTNSSLVGLNGGSGWSAAWGSGGTTSGTLKIVSGNLSYSGGGYAIAQTGSGTLSGSYFQFRGMNRPVPSLTGTIWFSVLVNSATAIEHSGVEFNNPRTGGFDYNASPFAVDLHGSALEVYYGSTSVSTSAATGLTLGSTHLILGSLTIGAGNDTLNVWVDPADLTNPGTPLFSGTTLDIGASLTLAGAFTYASTTGSGTYGRVDALRLSDGGGSSATGYFDVTGIPEPSASLLLLLALPACLTHRRRAAERIAWTKPSP